MIREFFECLFHRSKAEQEEVARDVAELKVKHEALEDQFERTHHNLDKFIDELKGNHG